MASNEFVTITQKQFETWKRRCSERAQEMRTKLFEEEDTPTESENATNTADETGEDPGKPQKKSLIRRILSYRFPSTIDPYGDSVYLFYQFLVSLSFLYNAYSIPLRMSFPYYTDHNYKVWMAFDYIADSINLIDIAVFQIRCQYIEGGDFVKERKATAMHYLKSRGFRFDIASVFPTDLLYLAVGFRAVLRINRLLKFRSFNAFNTEFEMVIDQAYIFRVARTTGYLLYFIHVDACLYYYISYLQNFQTSWGYQQEGNSYIRCFFWAFLTTVTIGNVESPTTNFEYLIQLINFFLGLFIFSIVIGQVKDSVNAHSADHIDYRKKKNDCIYHLETHNIPRPIQKKVRQWFEYTWETQKILDEGLLLSQIPARMHTEIAIDVHMEVLNKVELFKGCDKQLLEDLVLKLHPILFLPGDYICQKGEIGREMYIISNGTVQVVGDSKDQVFVTLSSGTAFGEISLLAIRGANRRTANIYSPGFATLFILKKNDLNEVVKNYPRTEALLKRKARQILNQDSKKQKQPPKAETRVQTTQETSTARNPRFANRFIRTIVREAENRNKNLVNTKNSIRLNFKKE